jgi:hypothetical protein
VGIERPLNEIVLFELPDRWLSESLLARTTASRIAWLETGGGLFRVGVLLNTNVDDLALLLRGVQIWLADSGLMAIRFEVDGRMYALERASSAVAASS